MPKLYERVRVETLVINTGANGRCDECGHLHNLYRKRGEGSRRLCAYCINAGALRRAELDSELQAVGAVVIRVEDLGAALEAMSFGAAVAGSMSRGFRNDIRPPFHEECTRMSGTASFAARCGRSAAHLARLALGEVRP